VGLAFGDHVLDIDRRELRRAGLRIALSPQIFDLIVYLVRNRDRVVSKDDLLGAVWGGRAVSDSAMTTAINAARHAIGDNGERQSLIRTIHRRGIRFVGEIEGASQQASVSAALSGAPATLALPDKPSIAVLPFDNMSSEPDREFFADGIAEDIVTALSRHSSLFVIARNSSFTYKGQAVDVRAVGRDLGVRYVLEGSVRKSGDRIRVTAQLIEAETGRHLWADRYDRQLTEIFAMQDEITGNVTAAILPAVQRVERERAARKPPDSHGSWESYHRGMWHYARLDPAENALARDFFMRAVTLEPSFAAAHAALSVTYASDGAFFFPLKRDAPVAAALEHARHALALNSEEPMGHVGMAFALILLARHAEGTASAETAVAVDPNSALAHASLGCARTYGGDSGGAVAPLEIAMRLSPFDPFTAVFLHWLARAWYLSGDYVAAISVARRAQQAYPNFFSPFRTLIAALGQRGQTEEAQQVMKVSTERFGESFRTLLQIATSEILPEDQLRLADGYRKAGVII
jgi:TolB-like protein/tetratricopeptide (TPR) repeat protein